MPMPRASDGLSVPRTKSRPGGSGISRRARGYSAWASVRIAMPWLRHSAISPSASISSPARMIRSVELRPHALHLAQLARRRGQHRRRIAEAVQQSAANPRPDAIDQGKTHRIDQIGIVIWHAGGRKSGGIRERGNRAGISSQGNASEYSWLSILHHPLPLPQQPFPDQQSQEQGQQRPAVPERHGRQTLDRHLPAGGQVVEQTGGVLIGIITAPWSLRRPAASRWRPSARGPARSAAERRRNRPPKPAPASGGEISLAW